MAIRSFSIRWFEKATGIFSGLDVLISAILLTYGAVTIDNKLVFLGTHSISELRTGDGQSYGERYFFKNLTGHAVSPSDKPLFFVCGGKLDFSPKIIRKENPFERDCYGYWLKDYLFPNESLFSLPAEAGMTIIAGDRDISDYTGTYAFIVTSVAILFTMLFLIVSIAIWLIPALMIDNAYRRFAFIEKRRAKIEKFMDGYYEYSIIFHIWFMFAFLFVPYIVFCEYLIRLALKLEDWKRGSAAGYSDFLAFVRHIAVQ